MNERRTILALIKQIKLYSSAQMSHLEDSISSMSSGLFNMIFPVKSKNMLTEWEELLE